MEHADGTSKIVTVQVGGGPEEARLSEAHVRMARALEMNPRKLGKLDNHEQERWKSPLPEFIEELHEKRFGKR